MTTTTSPSTTAVPAFLLTAGDRILNDDGTVSVVTWKGDAGDCVLLSMRAEGGTAFRDSKVRALRDMRVFNS